MVGLKDGADATQGALADAVATAASIAAGTVSFVALLKAIATWALAPILGAGENHVGEVGGNSARPSAAFNRQANTTAYAIGQVISGATVQALAVAGVARKANGTGRVTKVGLTKSGNVITNASFNIHLFSAAPGTVPADAAAFTGASGALTYLGAFSVTMTQAFSDGAKGFGVPKVGGSSTFAAAGGGTSLYAIIEAAQAYTPASGETFTLEIETDRD